MKISFVEKLKSLRFIDKCFKYDRKRYVKYSRTSGSEGKDHLLGLISMNTHIVEKGLTMPQMRQGFGQAVVLKLIEECRIWAASYDKVNPFYTKAVETVLEYNAIHLNAVFSFDEPFASELESFVKDNKEAAVSSQPKFKDASEYFSQIEASFPTFARSRHSLRHFGKDDIPVQLLIDSIDLAQSAPSSCNRQTTRVHIVTDKEDIKNILSVQNGNRGFGHLINKLLIVSFFIPHYGPVKERNLGYIDAGIFTMNLLYALHHNHIGACTLNWSGAPNDEEKLRSIIHIEDNESVVLLIGCGSVPDHEFSVTESARLKGKDITTIH